MGSPSPEVLLSHGDEALKDVVSGLGDLKIFSNFTNFMIAYEDRLVQKDRL